jgi:hypothetical protein
MATVYSLVCWGGANGKSVSVNSTTDYVTLTNHGLYNATGVQFTSGTLPSVVGAALALNTSYYSKLITSTTFELYYDAALTSKIDFTSNGSSLILKSTYYKTLADKSRWTTGSERIYDGISAWNAARGALANSFNGETCEIGQAFNEIRASGGIDFRCGVSPSTLITSSIAGTRTPAFHFGVVGTGYVFSAASTITLGDYTGVDGISIIYPSSTSVSVVLGGANGAFSNNILTSTGLNALGIYAWTGNTCRITNNLVMGFAYGIINYGAPNFIIANNIVAKCNFGIALYQNSASTYRNGFWYNNISIGNTTNWGITTTSLQGATNNFGISGDAPWVIGAGTTGTLATTDFVDFTNNDFRPASASSPQVEAAIDYYNSVPRDIAGNTVPNYMNGAAAYPDVGCYEFDHGYGPWPAVGVLTLQNVVSGSAVLITELNGTVIASPTATGSDILVNIPFYGTNRQVKVKIRKASATPFYQPYDTQVLITKDGGSSYIIQISDE